MTTLTHHHHLHLPILAVQAPITGQITKEWTWTTWILRKLLPRLILAVATYTPAELRSWTCSSKMNMQKKDERTYIICLPLLKNGNSRPGAYDLA
jgi:hypothetical protein